MKKRIPTCRPGYACHVRSLHYGRFTITVLLTGGPPEQPIKSSMILKHGICTGLTRSIHWEVINLNELFHSSAVSGRCYLTDESLVILREAEFLIEIIYTQRDHNWENWKIYEGIKHRLERSKVTIGFLWQPRFPGQDSSSGWTRKAGFSHFGFSDFSLVCMASMVYR